LAFTGGETNETYVLGIALAAFFWWPVAIWVLDLMYLLDLEIITFLSEKAWGQSDGPEPLSKNLWYKKVHTNHKPNTKVKVNLRNATDSNSSSSNYYTTPHSWHPVTTECF
jgi:hypothetical protein